MIHLPGFCIPLSMDNLTFTNNVDEVTCKGCLVNIENVKKYIAGQEKIKIMTEIKKSKFYLCKELEVHLYLGEFRTGKHAETKMYKFVNYSAEYIDGMKGFRPVSGRMILAAKRPYTLIKEKP